MAASAQALDSLQREVNGIFEQVGRLLAASSRSDTGVTLARASRLKQQYPAAELRFHEALDVLDAELQHAKAVMRRDLAVSRDMAGTSTGLGNAAQARSLTLAEPAHVEDIMSGLTESTTEAKPQQAKTTVEPGQQLLAELEDTKPSGSPSKSNTIDDDSAKVEEAEAKLEVDTVMQSVDTKQAQQDTDDIPPDTATMSVNADLDSLFNDPMSAGGQGGGSGPGTTFDGDLNGNGDFDFASFNASINNGAQQDDNDGDNISALIPGLSEYANDATAEPDFGAIFGSGGDGVVDEFSAFVADQQGNEKAPENLFDDMDFNFDMSGEGDNAGQDFDFDFTK